MPAQQSLTTTTSKRPSPLRLPSEPMRCPKPGWLENMTSHLRSPVSTARDRESMISNPELLLHGMSRPNEHLGHAAAVITSPLSAFEGGKEELACEAQAGSESCVNQAATSRWTAESGSCCSEPGTYDVHRIKLPPRTSSRQENRSQASQHSKEDETLPPLPLETGSLISAFSDGPPSPKSMSAFSVSTNESSSVSSAKSHYRKREKLMIPPPPVVTDRPVPAATRFSKPTSPLPAASPTSPFRALLLQPVQPSLPFIADEARLVTLVVGGQRFTSTQATVTSKPSKLTDFLHGLTMHEDEGLEDVEEPAKTPVSVEPHMEHPRRIFSISPMPSPNDVPGQHLQPAIVEPDAADLPMSAHATMFCVESEVPASISEEDWSADYDVSPMPTTTFNHLLQKRNSMAHSTGSCPPSLSAGSTAASSEDDGEARSQSPVEEVQASEQSCRSSDSRRPADQAIEVFLERDPTHYRAILTWLRCGQLPRQYNLSSTLDIFIDKQSDGSLELQQATKIPVPQLALFLHPLVSSLQDLKDEAKWLGLKDLTEECEDRVNELAAWLRNGARASASASSLHSDVPPTARPTSHHFKGARRPKQARFYGSAPSLPLPRATPEEHRQNWI